MTLQQYLASLRGKQVTVIGIGVSNRPLLRLLVGAGAEVTARDKKTEDQLGDIAPQLKEWGIRLALGERYMEDISGDVVFRTPVCGPIIPACWPQRSAVQRSPLRWKCFLRSVPAR